MIKAGTIMRHYKGERYKVISVVHPLSEIPTLSHESTMYMNETERVLHTELNEKITVTTFYLGATAGRVYYSELNEYLVIYANLETGERFVRPIQMFFEHVIVKDVLVHRFEPEE